MYFLNYFSHIQLQNKLISIFPIGTGNLKEPKTSITQVNLFVPRHVVRIHSDYRVVETNLNVTKLSRRYIYIYFSLVNQRLRGLTASFSVSRNTVEQIVGAILAGKVAGRSGTIRSRGGKTGISASERNSAGITDVPSMFLGQRTRDR